MTDMAPASAPTGEVGKITSSGGLPAWAAFDVGEDAPALTWPSSVGTYHKMRTDSQIDALARAVTLPIRRLRWCIDPNGARDEIVEMLSTDLALPIKGEPDPATRGRKRFNHDDHLRHSLLALWYGHMFMEQSGTLDENDDWRLRKLAPRMPQSISKIHVADDGGLKGITQHGYRPPLGRARGLGLSDAPPQISIDRLIAYVWEREGANWTGRSMLRTLYRHWLVKDRLIRIDALKHERFGAGLPVGTAPQGGNPAEYAAIAKQVKATEEGGVGLPYGATLALQGVSGSIPDTIASIKYHDEQMARTFLAMFLQLGQTETGSRALGDSFVDFFDLSLEAIANWYATITSEHLLEDIVDWNWGEDEQAPLLTFERRETNEPAISDLKSMVDAGLITVDDEVEKWIRDRYNLPEKKPEAEVINLPVAARRRRPFGHRSSDSDVAAHMAGQHDQKSHARGAGSLAVLTPESKLVYSQASAKSLRAELTEAGHGDLVEAVTDWQFNDTAGVVKETRSGGPRGDALKQGIRDSEPTEIDVYRGIAVADSGDAVLAAHQPGAEIELGVSSFSSKIETAAAFGVGVKESRAGKKTKVMIQQVKGARSLPIEKLSETRMLAKEREWVSGGKYKVLQSYKSDGWVVVQVQQLEAP